MPSELTHVAWADVRHDYEHTEKPVEDICAEHRISSGTLRNRVRRWGWTRRRPPIPAEGPAAALVPAAPEAAPIGTAASLVPHLAPGEASEPASIVPGLQNAVGRVLPAIEAIVAKLGAGSTSPREMERAARSLASLTRTLRELNTLLSQHQAPAADDDMPEDIDAFRIDLARRIDLFVASRTGDDTDAQTPET
jgi:hypothetical protein